jgi:hypothetical protein
MLERILSVSLPCPSSFQVIVWQDGPRFVDIWHNFDNAKLQLEAIGQGAIVHDNTVVFSL